MTSRPVVPIIGRCIFNEGNPKDEGNPGDVYILIGLQYLIKNAIGPYTPILLNKFSEDQFKSFEHMIRDAGYVVISGMPQFNCYSDWCFWYDDKFWDYLEKWNVKAIPLAGGAGFPNPRMSPKQLTDRCINDAKTMEIMEKRRRLTIYQTVRDKHAEDLIKAVGINGETIPCSALLAAENMGLSKDRGRSQKVAIVPCSPTNIASEIGGADVYGYHRKVFEDIYSNVKKDNDVIVICHGFKEYMNLKDVIPSNHLFVTNDHAEIMNVYKECGVVISARLHGVIASAGMGDIRVQHIAMDTRCSAIDVINEWTGSGSYIGNVMIDDPDLTEKVLSFVNEESRVATENSDTCLVVDAYEKVITSYFPNAC